MELLLRRLALVFALAMTSLAQENFTSVVASNPNLSNLTQFLGFYPQIVETLDFSTNISFLAPSNEAFTKLLAGPTGQALANDTSLVEALFSYHILNGTYKSTDFDTEPTFVSTLLINSNYTYVAGGQVVEALTTSDGTVFVSGLLQLSSATKTDIAFNGGVMHVIDTFLAIPQNISVSLDALNLTAGLGALETVALASTSPNSGTIFMPDNGAFQAIGTTFAAMTLDQLTLVVEHHMLLPNVVLYSSQFSNESLPDIESHGQLRISIEAGRSFVNGAAVTVPNVIVAEGVVHVIDRVLNPDDTTQSPNPAATSPVPQFSGSPLAGGELPFTSGVPAPSTAISTPALLLGAATGTVSSIVSATSAPGNSPSPPSSTGGPISGTEPSSSSSDLSSGAKAGIGVGCALAAVFVLALAFFCFRRSKRANRSEGEMPYPKAAEISPAEKNLAAELATRRDHAAELPATIAQQKPAPVKSSVADSEAKVDAVQPESRQELDGTSVGPELAERGSTVKRPKSRAEVEGYSSFG